MELLELKEMQELLKKENKDNRKPDEHKGFFHKMDPVKLYIILVLSYPIVGPAYTFLLKQSVVLMAASLR